MLFSSCLLKKKLKTATTQACNTVYGGSYLNSCSGCAAATSSNQCHFGCNCSVGGYSYSKPWTNVPVFANGKPICLGNSNGNLVVCSTNTTQCSC